MHVDDPRMKPLFEKCAQLKMPVNIHVAEDTWNYLPGDSINDGLMNAHDWRVDMTKPDILNHSQLIHSLDNVVKNNPKTTFIACHLANTCSDLNILGRMLDAYPNLYADLSARYSEIAAIPRFVHSFLEKYADRILYGTDMGVRKEMYHITFRILETADEHFYYHDYFSHHWPLHGLALTDATLRKIYNGNGKRIVASYRKD
jgi:predicted TIM-barrel fold metal-dependent hydrolase